MFITGGPWPVPGLLPEDLLRAPEWPGEQGDRLGAARPWGEVLRHHRGVAWRLGLPRGRGQEDQWPAHVAPVLSQDIIWYHQQERVRKDHQKWIEVLLIDCWYQRSAWIKSWSIIDQLMAANITFTPQLLTIHCYPVLIWKIKITIRLICKSFQSKGTDSFQT